MGCFNLKGFLSRVTIQYNDDIVLMIGLQKHTTTQQYYTCQNIVPITLPIYGKYDDYGGITDVEDTPSARWIKENLGEIDDVVDAVNECMGYRNSIQECIDSDNSCHPETKVRYVYDKLLEQGLCPTDSLCLLVEHRDVYENWPDSIQVDTFHTIDKAIAKAKKRKEEKIELFNLTDEQAKRIPMRYDLTLCFGNDSYNILCLHDAEFLLNEQPEETKKLQKFIWFMTYMGTGIQIPMQYSQNDYFKSDIEYHEKCIKLIEDLKLQHDWYDEDEYDDEYTDEENDE